ncbi:OmpA family protein [Flaviaesturariibacter amylovorans]|uniref:OmpA-like domain-containing protein n=1 Tax=Flaviaesturariibacter amylovorans TaxID=1084520 RepID=A0ABP8GJG4_9BACT
MAGTYNYPAKPRNQWEIGIKGGLFTISGDVASLPSFGLGAHVRKAFGYLFSARLEYTYGIAKGLNWKPAYNYSNNSAWSNAGYRPANIPANPGGDLPVYYNYKTNVQDLMLEGVITLNNVRFHRSKTGYALYAFAGVGGSMYDAKVNALDANGNAYNFNSIAGNTWKTRKDTRKALKSMMDNTYETPAENHGPLRPKLFGNSYMTVGSVGLGIAFKLSNRFNIAIEDRFTFTNDDLFDGQRWAEQVPGEPVLTQNFDAYNFASLGINMNLGSKSTEPLWWMNPLDYAYSEIRNPRLMKLPKPVLPDTDGDGVTDQFDLEQTPAGAPVDAHGVSRDTDGDGVPDFRDKELVTPTVCQPVDADGVGKCPCPDGCKVVDTSNTAGACARALGQLPSITFSGASPALSSTAKSMLASVAARIKNNPGCKVVVIGYCQSTKAEQQRSWDRVNAVINYMVEREGVGADRFIFQYGQEGGDCNTVDLRGASEGEDGPTNVPAPHPNLQRRGN